MLGLATHEIHLSLLKEVFPIEESTKKDRKPYDMHDKSQSMLILQQHFEFLHVWILREYLELDMQIIDLPDEHVYDIERIVDDFIFMCFFLGNDFLPSLPTLQVFEDGIGLLMHVYKTEFKNFGGYLVDMQQVNEPHLSYIDLNRVETFVLSVGRYEELVFKKRAKLLKINHRRISSAYAEESRTNELSTSVELHETNNRRSDSVSDYEEMVKNTKEFKEELKKCVLKMFDVYKDVFSSDKVELGSPGWKQRYYKEKFAVEGPKETEILRTEIVQKYTEGLCWVLKYYFSDVPSWNWYYPYHYGLFASEIKGLSEVQVKFHKGCPFKPFDQLLAVLPPKSAHALPEAYRHLMTSTESKIAEFYPSDFEVDTFGKRYMWHGICKLPFIDAERLLNETSQLEAKIEMNEAKRNVETTDQLFWRASNSCVDVILDYISQHSDHRDATRIDVHDQPILCFNFKLPVASFRAPCLLECVEVPKKTVFENDILEAPLWHEPVGRPSVVRGMETHTVSVSEAKIWRSWTARHNQNESEHSFTSPPDRYQNPTWQSQRLTQRSVSNINPRNDHVRIGNSSQLKDGGRGRYNRRCTFREYSSDDPNRW